MLALLSRLVVNCVTTKHIKTFLILAADPAQLLLPLLILDHRSLLARHLCASPILDIFTCFTFPPSTTSLLQATSSIATHLLIS